MPLNHQTVDYFCSLNKEQAMYIHTRFVDIKIN